MTGKRSLQTFLAVCIGLLASMVVAAAAGEQPFLLPQVLWGSLFSSWFSFGTVLSYAVPLSLTGLSVAIAFRAGLFNIGAEGQMVIGAVVASGLGLHTLGLPPIVHWALVGISAFIAGGAWSLFAGWIRVARGGHEVITTIMMNYLAMAIGNWVAVDLFPNPQSQSAETLPILPQLLFSPIPLFDEAPVTWLGLIPILLALFAHFIFDRTVWGFETLAAGSNAAACPSAGIDFGRRKIEAMALAGGMAGLAGFIAVYGYQGSFRVGFSPGYGFMGITVAFLAACHPLGTFPSALLLALLHKGTMDLELESELLTRDLASFIQAIMVVAVAAPWLSGRWSRLLGKPLSSGLGKRHA